jgi:hypothetical protein
MPTPLKDVLARKSPERRAAIEKDAAQMIADERRFENEAISLANEICEECGPQLSREAFNECVTEPERDTDRAWTIYLAITDRAE